MEQNIVQISRGIPKEDRAQGAMCLCDDEAIEARFVPPFCSASSALSTKLLLTASGYSSDKCLNVSMSVGCAVSLFAGTMDHLAKGV